jgi:chemotaxis protein MotB
MVSADVLNLRRDRLQTMAKRLQQRFNESPDMKAIRDHVEIMLTNEGLRIELIENSDGFFFATGKSEPSESGKLILGILGQELGALDMPVRIDGYTDAVPYAPGKVYTNWELSADRANVARRILTMSGLHETQIDQVRAYAATRPKIDDDRTDPRNRRVTITMLLESEEDYYEEQGIEPPIEVETVGPPADGE